MYEEVLFHPTNDVLLEVLDSLGIKYQITKAPPSGEEEEELEDRRKEVRG